jgi:hypothetical protein
MTAMNKNKHTSYNLTELKNDLRKRALKEKDEEERRDYWRLYYKAVDAEHEVNDMVKDAEIRRMLELAIAYGMLPDNWKEELAQLLEDKANKKKKPPVDSNIDDEDIPPRQMRLFDEE